MNILVYTSLYPSRENPTHGIFVSELTQAMARLIRVRVVVPENGLRRLMERTREGFAPSDPLDVVRCRFWTAPKVLKSLDHRLMAFFSATAFSSTLTPRPDLVHAHYAYPDAAAALLLAQRAGLPLVITCHGSDLNLLAKDPARRKIISRTLRQARAVAAVSEALQSAAVALGAYPKRVHHIPNGVDLSRFTLGDKRQARAILGLPQDVPIIAAAGRLEPVKGYDRLIRAVALQRDVRLVLVGSGSLARSLKRLAGELGVSHRVVFAGRVDHASLAPYFQAADTLAISSHSEGWPTVIHEALACGTPVVAPAVGGIPEALAAPSLGVVVASNESELLAGGIRRILARGFDRHELRQAASPHGWDAVARRYMEIFAGARR